MTNSLLPPSATPQEHAIEEATSGIDRLPVPVRDTWNPDTCPVHLLPWLAWALSVDHWDSQWDEDVKRDVIRRSIQVHRKKGTRMAVESALRALGVNITMDEWFETGGEPHTFTVTALANASAVRADGEAMVDSALYDKIRRGVDATKPARSHYSLRVGSNNATGVGVGVYAQGGCYLRKQAETETFPVLHQSVAALGAKAQAVGFLRKQAETKAFPALHRSMAALGTKAQAVSIVRLKMEVIS